MLLYLSTSAACRPSVGGEPVGSLDDDDEVEREGAAWDGAATVTVWTTGFAVSTIWPGASVVVGALVLAGSDETVSLAGVPDVVAAGTRWITT